MARTAGKRKLAASSTTSKPPASTLKSTSSLDPPSPFQHVPSSLQKLASTLPTTHLYLFHLDHTAPSLKQRVFLVPVFLNLIISLLLCVRIYYAAPVYFEQILTILGYDTYYKVEPSSMTVPDLMSTVGVRTALLMVDYAIFGLLGSWPWQFLFGNKLNRYTGPLSWRWTLGIRDTEVIVRRSRQWDTTLGFEDEEGKKWSSDDELTLKLKIEPAMRDALMSKTGYLLLDKDWDLDFEAMIDTHQLVEENVLDFKDVDQIVLVHYQKQWLIWRTKPTEEGARVDSIADSKLRTFKDKLTQQGQEGVFYRWIEIVQYESSLPGGFTQGRQAEAMRELRRLLEERRVDYAKFWEEIGGQKGVPGLEAENAR